ncbi:MAG: type II toxin-antitoxin system HigB family toxin [Blastocatellia bacterium]
MHIISRKKLKEFSLIYPDAEAPLEAWYRTAKQASWQSIAEVRISYPQADAVGICTVFNIGGNKYRLITKIYYKDQVVLIRNVLTHPEYDKGAWKNDCSK